jgi:pimeloyl-ACP methyl ester carboxylesterase
VTAHLDLHDAIHVGHSTGGGEVAHYIARHGENRVAKAVLISSVPPKGSSPRRRAAVLPPRAAQVMAMRLRVW